MCLRPDETQALALYNQMVAAEVDILKDRNVQHTAQEMTNMLLYGNWFEDQFAQLQREFFRLIYEGAMQRVYAS